MLATLTYPEPAMRTFVFQREQTQQSIIIDHEIDLRLNFIDLNRLLGEYCPPLQHRIAIYDPNLNHFVRFDNIGAENGYLHRDYLQPRIVMIRYRKRYDLHSDSDSVDSSMEADRKGARSKERTIAQVIEQVKKWRDLHFHGHRSMRKRLNLQDAAKLVGISKKSLDDYYCQLRLGEFYEFDFAGNLHEKIGVLRNFVKQHKDKNPTQEQKRKQNQKHPKNLKVIDQFQLSTKTLLIPEDEDKIMVEAASPIQMSQQLPYQPNYLIDPLDELRQNSNHVYQQLFNLQHDFFKGFQLALDDAHDPYNSIPHDFRKKEYQEQCDSFLYF